MIIVMFTLLGQMTIIVVVVVVVVVVSTLSGAGPADGVSRAQSGPVYHFRPAERGEG